MAPRSRVDLVTRVAVGAEEFFGVEVVVEGVLAGVHGWGWVPVGASGVGVDAGGPAHFGEAVVGSAAQGEGGASVWPPLVQLGWAWWAWQWQAAWVQPGRVQPRSRL